MDWNAVLNVLVSSLVAGGLAGATSWQTSPASPWQAHAAVGAVTALAALGQHFRQSPMPDKRKR